MKTYDELFTLITQRGVHAVFGEPGEGFFIEQNAAELAEFLIAMQALSVQSVLEVGTGYKAGLARFLHDDMAWDVTSLDVKNYGHAFGGIRFEHPRDFEHDEAAGVAPEPYDLVLIDADHTYEGVKDDHEFYARYATKVIAFHDICGLRDCEGVAGYWAEMARAAHWEKINGINQLIDPLKPGYHEIIADSEQRGGIGYVVLSEVPPEPVKGEMGKLTGLIPKAPMSAMPKVRDVQPPTKKPATPRKRTPAKKATVKK